MGLGQLPVITWVMTQLISMTEGHVDEVSSRHFECKTVVYQDNSDARLYGVVAVSYILYDISFASNDVLISLNHDWIYYAIGDASPVRHRGRL